MQIPSSRSLKRPAAQAHVPATWGLEIANAIAMSEARGIVLENRSQAFLSALDATLIVCEPQTHAKVLTETLQLARRHRLSSYDASYLELALRTALPLAALDEDLRRAAQKAGVKHFKAS